jgi:hypothetical protein
VTDSSAAGSSRSGEPGGGLVGLRRRLVGVRQLGRQQAVEAKVTVAGEVDEQRDVTVRERRGNVAPAQYLEAFPDVGPGVQSMPCAD